MTDKQVKPLAGTLIRGSGWAIGIRWFSKFLGIISLAICARVLLPEDYGLVSMSMVIVGFASILVEFGLDAALIRDPNATEEDFNTAWSLRVIQSILICLIILVAIPFATDFYKDERVAPIMAAVALSGFIGGFQNIYVVNYLRHLNFRQDFIVSSLPRLLSFIAGVSAVLILKNYWGLVIGQAVNDISRAVVSYAVCREYPRWSLSRWRKIGSFSIWYFGAGIANFIAFQFDRLIVGSLGGSKLSGIYLLSREVASLPNSELVEPVGRALLPTLSQLQNDKDRQTAAIKRAFAGITLITVPMSVGLSLTADEFIRLFLGEQWVESAPIVSLLALVGLAAGYRATARNVLVSLGKVKANTVFAWIQAGFALGFLYPAYQWGELKGLAWLHLSSGFTIVAMIGLYLHRLRVFPLADQWRELHRPFVAALMMFISINAIETPTTGMETLSLLAVKVSLGVFTYTISLLFIWFFSGKPNSIERTIIESTLSRLTGKKASGSD